MPNHPHPRTLRALEHIHQSDAHIPNQQVIHLLKTNLITHDPTSHALRLTRKGQHLLHTNRAHAKRRKRLPELARQLAPHAPSLEAPIREILATPDEVTLKRHRDALVLLHRTVRFLLTHNERTLLQQLTLEPSSLAAAAAALGWDGHHANKTLQRLIRDTRDALTRAQTVGKKAPTAHASGRSQA